MNDQKKTNASIYADAVEVLPGGVSRNTIFHKPFPHYVAGAQGCIVTDIDGVERVDFANNMASLIHGHAYPPIVEAVIEQLRKGTAYTLATEIEVRYAQHLTSRTPSFEKIRFVNSGTEAVMSMIKTARAFTGKPKIARAEGSYNGSYDYVEVSQVSSPDNWGDLDKPNRNPLAYGTPQGVLDDVIIYPFNDVDRTIRLLDETADDIACVLVDPIPHRVGLFEATDDFIEAIYAWTRKHKTLMVFDEVITYRTNYGGAQQNYRVKPDITALGKMIGGGFPVGAFAGRSDVMKVMDPNESPLRLPHSGTFSANPITMTAGYAAMQDFDQEAVLKLNELTATAVAQVKEAIRGADVPMSISGSGSMFRLHPRTTTPTSYRKAYQGKKEKAVMMKILDHLFYKENIIMVNTGTTMFSTAITQKEVDQLSQGILNALKANRDELIEVQDDPHG
ncbi:MAG: aminotransferase class III-fold pyridoxal phosphate-dependent enzyme [FCB group bacterium]|nr:aminotransferase class III-fold pyridoxal phosphate-dependent enzyme [FCB group bacterium]MBL7028813.1 aminotransferase class III-fold pyridoxal phosphate-dependent enzyme [Candidatus Neomarinimicrobiota bacterium]MBL7121732.1 aminotransferase class III-fold pyridoxal phosphate-dependent enzyme [Candidatus Neomarinimicrobiota bacterium]